MAHTQSNSSTSLLSRYLIPLAALAFGAFLAAAAIELVFIPHSLIDGGIVGIAMLLSQVFGHEALPFLLVGLNLPFVYLAYRNIGRFFVLMMLYALLVFAGSIAFLQDYPMLYEGDVLDIIVLGGVGLGGGLGLIIRYGGCLDGTEILGIIVNRSKGYTVGQVVFAINILIFAAAGFVFDSWRPAFHSLMTYFVAMKVMDTVIVGLEETKAVYIISSKSQEISDAILQKLGLGLTLLYGRGGFSQEDREVIYVVVERLQLAELREIVMSVDNCAFMAIQNLHEVANGRHHSESARCEKLACKEASNV